MYIYEDVGMLKRVIHSMVHHCKVPGMFYFYGIFHFSSGVVYNRTTLSAIFILGRIKSRSCTEGVSAMASTHSLQGPRFSVLIPRTKNLELSTYRTFTSTSTMYLRPTDRWEILRSDRHRKGLDKIMQTSRIPSTAASNST